MGDRKRRQKGRTWIEASKLVLEKYPNKPLSFREILQDIQELKLKDVSGNGSEACLNAMLHIGSRGQQSLFYKVVGLNGVYGLRRDLPQEAKALLEVKTDDVDSPSELEETGEEKYLPMKKRPLCVLPKKAHHYIPSLKRFQPDLAPSIGSQPSLSKALDNPGLPDAITMDLTSPHTNHSKTDGRVNGTESPLPRRKSDRVLRPKYRNHSHHHHKHHRRKSGFVPRIILKPLKPPEGGTNGTKEELRSSSRGPQTISEILAQLHGKPRRRLPKRNRKLSLKGLERRSLSIDLETPDSILVHVNPKSVINKHTFSSLPVHYQYKLLRLLPEVDTVRTSDGSLRLRAAALDNEFFARACTQWRSRLKNGEFTPEMQVRLQQELEKERAKVDPWKVDNFEPFWGQSYVNPLANLHATLSCSPAKRYDRSTSVPPVESRSKTKHTGLDTPSTVKEQVPKKEKVPKEIVKEPPAEVEPVKKEKIILKLNLKEVKAAAAAAAAAASAQNSKHSKTSPRKPKIKPILSEMDSQKTSSEYVCSQLLTDMAYATQKGSNSERTRTIPGILKNAHIMPPVNLKRPGEMPLNRKRDEPVEKRSKQDDDDCTGNVSNTRGLQRTIGSIASNVSARTVAQVKASNMKQGQTRTLAQIKAQTLARAQALGQTKTLAQIKAQTSAKLQQRSPPDRTARPYGHVPTILGRGRPHSFMNLKSIVPTNATAVSAIINNPLSDLSASMTALVANQSELAGSTNQVVVVSSEKPVLQTVKPIIIKAQPGMSLVIVSQPNVNNPTSTVTSKVDVMDSPQVVKAVGHLPSVLTSTTSPSTSSSKHATQVNSSSSQPTCVPSSCISPQTKPMISSPLDTTQLVKVFAVDPNKRNFVRITDGASVAQTQIKMHPLSSSSSSSSTEQLSASQLGKAVAPTKNAVVRLVAATNNDSEADTSNQGRQQTTLFLNSASPAKNVTRNISSSKDPAETNNGTKALDVECACKLKALVSCKGCGAFCHHDCINSSSNLCVSCLIR